MYIMPFNAILKVLPDCYVILMKIQKITFLQDNFHPFYIDQKFFIGITLFSPFIHDSTCKYIHVPKCAHLHDNEACKSGIVYWCLHYFSRKLSINQHHAVLLFIYWPLKYVIVLLRIMCGFYFLESFWTWFARIKYEYDCLAIGVVKLNCNCIYGWA